MKDNQHLLKWTAISFVGFIIVYTIFYLWLDLPIAAWTHANLPDTVIYTLARNISKIFKPGMWVILAIIVALMGYFGKSKSQAKNYYFFASCIILAYILCGILKVTLARYRPMEFITNNLYGFHFFSIKDIYNSTPSGATVTVFAALFSLALIVNKRWITVLLLTIATIIGLSRIIILQHYPSDVIFGAYLGILVVYWCQCLFFKENWLQSMLKKLKIKN